MQELQAIAIDHVVSTDPPYYDNVPYADLSDFFYVWLRRLSARPPRPVRNARRAQSRGVGGGRLPTRRQGGVEAFFLDGMTQAMHRLAEEAHPAFPVTIYYAFKQAEGNGAESRLAPAGKPSSTRSSAPGLPQAALGRCERNWATVCAAWTPMPWRPASSSSAGTRAADRRPQLAASSSPRSIPNYPGSRLTARQHRAGRPRRPPSARAWLSTPATPRCSTPRASRSWVRELWRYQRDPRRGIGRAGGRLRRRQPLGACLVRAYGLHRGRVRRGRDAVDGQEHQRCGAGRGGHREVQPRQGAALATRRTSRRLGPEHRPSAHGLGDGAPARPRLGERRRSTRPRWSPSWEARPSPPGNSATASTPSASARSEPPRHSPTTASSRAGPRSLGWLGRVASPASNRPRSSKATRNNPWPSPTTTASARRWNSSRVGLAPSSSASSRASTRSEPRPNFSGSSERTV